MIGERGVEKRGGVDIERGVGVDRDEREREREMRER